MPKIIHNTTKLNSETSNNNASQKSYKEVVKDHYNLSQPAHTHKHLLNNRISKNYKKYPNGRNSNHNFLVKTSQKLTHGSTEASEIGNESQFSIEQAPIEIESEITSWQMCDEKIERMQATLGRLRTLSFYNLQHHTENLLPLLSDTSANESIYNLIVVEESGQKLSEEILSLTQNTINEKKFIDKFIKSQNFKIEF